LNLPDRVEPRHVEAPPDGYAEWFADVATRVRATQRRMARSSNRETIRLYWSIGRDVIDRRQRLGWGRG
jgi:hypothetical protein